MNNYRIGGVAVWNEMTDIDAFHIVCDARSMSNKGTQNAFHRWDAKSIVIDARFLEGGGDYYIDKKGNQGDFIETNDALAHEIGHNVFWNWHFRTQMGKKYTTGTGLFPRSYSKTNIPFGYYYLEATANVFMDIFGYKPILGYDDYINQYNFTNYEEYLHNKLGR